MTHRYAHLLEIVGLAVGLVVLPSPTAADIAPTPAQKTARHETFRRWIVAAGHECDAVRSSRRVTHAEVGLPRDIGLRVFAADCGGRGYYIYTEHLKPGHWIEPMKNGGSPRRETPGPAAP